MKKKFLTMQEMLAITACYPANLLKKEEKDKKTIIEFKDGDGTIAGLMKDIGDKITSLQAKGATKDELTAIETRLKDFDLKKIAEKGDIEIAKKEMQAQYNELTVKLLNDGRLVKMGANDSTEVRKLLTEKKESIGKTSSKANPSVLLEIKASQFWGGMNRKASNMTESGNLLGTDPIQPLRMAGIHFDPRRPKHIRELINTIVTDSPILSYAQETGYTDGSAMRAQGTAAGQSDFTITRKEVIVQALSTFFTITKEMMTDTDWINNYIETRGVSWMLMVEDSNIFSGNGISPNLTGIQPIAQAYDNRSLKIGKVAGDLASQSINYFDILCGMASQLIDGTNGYYSPTGIIMHPTDELIMNLARNAYGSLQFPMAAMGAGLEPMGAKIAANTVVAKGNALIGDFQLGATLAQREAMEITFSNQHVDNFTKGFITVLVEERLGLVVHNPNAFVYGNFASGEASGSI